MIRRTAILPALLLALSAAALQGQTASSSSGDERGISFEQNLGQIVDNDGVVRPDILYVALSREMNLFLGRSMVSYVFNRYEGDWAAWHRADGHTDGDFQEEFRQTYGREFVQPRMAQHRVDLELVGSSPDVRVESSEEQVNRGYRNFYLPHCPDGVLGVRSFGTVTWREVYRNIDMVLRSTDSDLKCDFVVRPGGNPADIRLRYAGAEQVRLDSTGGTVATTPFGTLGESAPVSYTADGEPVASHFTLTDGVLSFEVGAYDSHQTLVIDPYRLWSTYYGGTGTETVLGGHSGEMDREGNPYFCGSTSNTGSFPTSAGTTQYSGGGTDAMLVKFRPDGTRAWAIIYGGNAGFLGDLAHGITSDTTGNVYVAGHTDANNFPVTAGTQQTNYGGGGRDAFIIKFDSGGTRQWATFYGGSNSDDGYGFGLDGEGNPILGAATASTGLQTGGMTANSGGTSDALIARFDRTTGTRIWATYFGGSGNDQAFAIAGDNSGNVICVGWTNSAGLATGGVSQTTRGGSYDGFAVRYNSSGTRLWSTYIGGAGRENESGSGSFGTGYGVVATDPVGNIYLAGSTTSTDFPTLRPYQATFGGGTTDAYLVKLDTNGVRLWSTYLGGTAGEEAYGVASNNRGEVLITGYTSAALPARLISGDALQGSYGGGARDAFILKFDSSGQTLRFGTHYGGTASDEGAGISVDPSGSFAVVGETSSNNFPVGTGPLPPGTPPLPGGVPFQTTMSTAPDAWLALIRDSAGPPSGVRRDGANAGGAAILSVTPHPIGSSATVIFSTAERGPVSLELTTISGGRVTVILQEMKDAGRHTASIPAGVSAGSYLLVLTTPTGRAVHPVQCVR